MMQPALALGCLPAASTDSGSEGEAHQTSAEHLIAESPTDPSLPSYTCCLKVSRWMGPTPYRATVCILEGWPPLPSFCLLWFVSPLHLQAKTAHWSCLRPSSLIPF